MKCLGRAEREGLGRYRKARLAAKLGPPHRGVTPGVTPPYTGLTLLTPPYTPSKVNRAVWDPPKGNPFN